jgi:hypothetical protein
MAQVVEHQHKDLGSILSTRKKKEKMKNPSSVPEGQIFTQALCLYTTEHFFTYHQDILTINLKA